MQFKYAPEGVEPKVWEFTPEKLMNAEAEAIERHTGMTFGEWQDAVPKISVLAIHGLLFVLLKREIPTLKWDEVQFSLSEISMDPSEAELIETRDELTARRERGETLSDAEAELLADVIAEIGEAKAEPEQDAAPKDLSLVKNDDSSTSSPSAAS